MQYGLVGDHGHSSSLPAPSIEGGGNLMRGLELYYGIMGGGGKHIAMKLYSGTVE